MKKLKIAGALMMMASPFGCMAGGGTAGAVGMALFWVGFALFVAGRLVE